MPSSWCPQQVGAGAGCHRVKRHDYAVIAVLQKLGMHGDTSFTHFPVYTVHCPATAPPHPSPRLLQQVGAYAGPADVVALVEVDLDELAKAAAVVVADRLCVAKGFQ